MKKRIFYGQFLGIIFTSLLGIFLHFLFELTNKNIILSNVCFCNYGKLFFEKEQFWMIVFWMENKLFQTEENFSLEEKTAFICLGLLAVTFTILTFIPPQIPLFQDPITGSYGF